jgi:osmoprotectant transport system ATP-binding protein
MADARAAAGGIDAGWAVVVADDGTLVGWVSLEPGIDGLVSERTTPFAVQVPMGTSLKTALAEMLQHDVRWVPVTDGDRYRGVLTPNRIHAAMRRTVGGAAVEDGRRPGRGQYSTKPIKMT